MSGRFRAGLALGAAVVAGFAAGLWLAGGPEPGFVEEGFEPSASTSVSPSPARSGDAAGETAGELRERLARVEAALRAEREQRAELEARLEELDAQVAALERATRGAPSAPAGQQVAETTERRARAARFGGPAEDDRPLAEVLVAAGFSTDRAAWIERRVAELPMELLRAQYEARRTGGPPEGPGVFGGVRQALRAELGDAEYERYLQALGRPTAVPVRGVLPSSPAEQAGLLPGDEIVAYDGKRVFDTRDLNRLTLEGEPGQPVLVDIVRNGQRLQVVMPRGPIGVTGGRFGR
ncbi:MAG TPA: PDZ domain-containing protein [Gammaproteobacteria bacterium]